MDMYITSLKLLLFKFCLIILLPKEFFALKNLFKTSISYSLETLVTKVILRNEINSS